VLSKTAALAFCDVVVAYVRDQFFSVVAIDAALDSVAFASTFAVQAAEAPWVAEEASFPVEVAASAAVLVAGHGRLDPLEVLVENAVGPVEEEAFLVLHHSSCLDH